MSACVCSTFSQFNMVISRIVTSWYWWPRSWCKFSYTIIDMWCIVPVVRALVDVHEAVDNNCDDDNIVRLMLTTDIVTK